MRIWGWNRYAPEAKRYVRVKYQERKMPGSEVTNTG